VAVFSDALWLAPAGSRCRALDDGRPETDPLLAWQLLWRGENLWTNGSIYPEDPSRRTVFVESDSGPFRRYIESAAPGTIYVITERKNSTRLHSILAPMRGWLGEVHPISNKFALFQFQRKGASAARGRDPEKPGQDAAARAKSEHHAARDRHSR